MEYISLDLRIPATRLECAAWIQKQIQEHENVQPVESWASEPAKALLAAIESFKGARKGCPLRTKF